MESNRSINSHMISSNKKYTKKKVDVPKIDLTKVAIEDSDEEEDIDKMIEEAIEVELEQNPEIANQFDTMEDFKRYIFDKYFNEYNNSKQTASDTSEKLYNSNSRSHENSQLKDSFDNINVSLDRQNMKENINVDINKNKLGINLKNMTKNKD